MTIISRDPFSRSELHRDRVYFNPASKSGCSFCGSARYTPKGDRAFLFSYRREYDGGRVAQIKGKFCSIECMRSYSI